MQDGVKVPRIACIGECMIELAQVDLAGGSARVGFAGDTLNMAAYLARLLGGRGRVSYVTNLGVDAFSDRMMAMFAAEGLDCGLVGRHPDRLPGIYAIETDSAGERTFRYWRDQSAARTLFGGTGAELIGAGLEDLDRFDVICLSGITLAILPQEVRAALIARLAGVRAAGKAVVFDTNYRPRLWASEAAARDAFAAMWAVCTLALPSLDDEQRLYPGADAAAVLARIEAAGVPEVVLKRAAAGPVIRAAGADIAPALPVADRVVDTSGAGDSFNAGYLAARLTGAAPAAAAAAGHRLALAVIGQHGALIRPAAMPDMGQVPGKR